MTGDSINQFVDVIFKLKNRVDNLEASNFRESFPSLLSNVSDSTSTEDVANYTTGNAGDGEYDSGDEWDFIEWV